MARRPDFATRGWVEHVGPGDEIQRPFEQGDFMLTHSGSLVSKLTQLAQRIRFRGADHRYAYWSHAAVIVSPAGDLVEAYRAGVVRGKLADYARCQRTIVHIEASAEDRAQVAAFAERCLGLPYDRMTNMSIVLCYLTGTTLTFGLGAQMICGGLVARALERTTAFFEQDASHIMPADLARIYRVDPPADQRRGI